MYANEILPTYHAGEFRMIAYENDVDRQEQQYWQRVRQSPARTAREVRSQFRDIDRRLAELETYYVTSNPRLSAEIERLR